MPVCHAQVESEIVLCAAHRLISLAPGFTEGQSPFDTGAQCLAGHTGELYRLSIGQGRFDLVPHYFEIEIDCRDRSPPRY